MKSEINKLHMHCTCIHCDTALRLIYSLQHDTENGCKQATTTKNAQCINAGTTPHVPQHDSIASVVTNKVSVLSQHKHVGHMID